MSDIIKSSSAGAVATITIDRAAEGNALIAKVVQEKLFPQARSVAK